MAITTNSIVVEPMPFNGNFWAASLYSADFSGAEDLKAAVSGKKHYIKKILIYAQSVTDVTVTIGSAQGTAVTTIYLGPISLPDAGGRFEIDFGDNAMVVAVGTALSIDMSAGCPTMVYVEGKTA